MCGVSACENRQNRVSHGESVRVGSSGCLSKLFNNFLVFNEVQQRSRSLYSP